MLKCLDHVKGQFNDDFVLAFSFILMQMTPKMLSSWRAHLIKGLKEPMPNTEEELIDPKYSYKVLIYYGYHVMPNMRKFKKSQDRMVLKNGFKNLTFYFIFSPEKKVVKIFLKGIYLEAFLFEYKFFAQNGLRIIGNLSKMSFNF